MTVVMDGIAFGESLTRRHPSSGVLRGRDDSFDPLNAPLNKG